MNKALLTFATFAAVSLAASPALRADWPTFRDSVQRTGAADDKPGPKTPKVLWSYKAQEHFVASPVPEKGILYVSGLGPFNTAQFHALTLADKPKDRVLWSKASPFIKLPTVSAPAVVNNLLIFGDGMHQTDGAVLYGLDATTGRPLWQYPVDGKLVHMEGAPAVTGKAADTRVFIGGGDAGVFCIDPLHVTLGGKEQDLETVRPLIETRWTELVAKYEEARKKDPDFAKPPDESELPKPIPKLIWQKGKGAWHVDAPIAVTGEKVLVASAYVDDDKAGKRVMLCLNAKDGSTLWEAPLAYNPWGGPTVTGDTVLVGCSSIRFDPGRVKDAKGQLLALDLATGKVKWQKDYAGGILSPAAVAEGGDTALIATTDGKVRALAVASGEEKWAFDAGHPFFAAPAVTTNAAYAVDLKGVCHAINLADGKPLWSLDVCNDPAVQAPGAVFGPPAILNGRIYLATHTLEGAAGNPEGIGAVACIGDASEAGPRLAGKGYTVDAKTRSITIPCSVAPRKLPTLKDIYPLEVVATYPTPQGQKAHETVVVFDTGIRISDIFTDLRDVCKATPGKPTRADGVPPEGDQLKISLVLPGPTGKPRLVPIEKTIVDARTNKPLPPLHWYFTGSTLRQVDPDKPDKVFGADLSGTLISIYPVTDECLVQSNLTLTDSSVLKLEMNHNILPEEGTSAELRIEVVTPPRQPDASNAQRRTNP